MGIDIIAHKAKKFLADASGAYSGGGPGGAFGFLLERTKNYAVRGFDVARDGLSAALSLSLAAVTGWRLFYVIGNSHVSGFRGNWRFLVCPIGAATAHNLNRKGSSTRANEQLFGILGKVNKRRDCMMLVFGEIDCRVHFYNAYMKEGGKVQISELMDRTLANYGQVILELKNAGYAIIVHGIPPASRQGNIYGFRFYAPAEKRARINREFNNKLETFCRRNGVDYFNVHPLAADKDGFIRKEYAADEVHLNGRVKELFWKWAGRKFGKN